MINNDRLIRACRRQSVDRSPVWMMRQAGRYLPEYRAVRGKTDFLTLCKTPEMAAEVSMQPFDILGVDAVIMFSDILIPVEAMGVKLDIIESRGPVIETPIRTAEQVEKLIVPDPVEKTGFVMDVIRLLRQQLDNRAPLIGFAGAPFTLASYLIEGGTSRNFAEIKRMMFSSPTLLHQLLEKIADTVTDYLNAQIEAGAQVVQLFDTWAGELSAGDFEEFALEYQQRIFSRLHRGPSALSVPAILYVNGCSSVLEKMAESGANVLSLDWRIDIAEANRRLQAAGFDNLALQGNLDPCALLGTPETIAEGVQEILKKAGPTGHIMNLGHGIMPMVPVENARAFIEAAKAGIREVA
ncbi:MAG TPA: uroporphyrinogen decarboxylase [Blastocatellia bacterium]|nr:uroporphyrinogen decarboxylase [Blastocatellia bacterium]